MYLYITEVFPKAEEEKEGKGGRFEWTVCEVCNCQVLMKTISEKQKVKHCAAWHFFQASLC